jgi:CxxC motif-containing protein (DUF1111 family)
MTPNVKITRRGLRVMMLASAVVILRTAMFAGDVNSDLLRFAARDPGVRTGPPGAGGPLPGLTPSEQAFFGVGLDIFQEVDSVTGVIPNTGAGLGPRFNLDVCAGCHTQPAVGGTSPAVNPQVDVAKKEGATNGVPFFITKNGPVREARFQLKPDGSRDGGVHDLFTIAGRSDAPGCVLAQPDFNAAQAHHNLVFRIPTPVFGAGLIEAIPDSEILANMVKEQSEGTAMGISGHPNRHGPGQVHTSGSPNISGNDGSITRFGWKAQNKSLAIFAGEAYNVEMGVTNELFQTERDETPSCLFNGTPEDHTNFDAAQPTDVPSDVMKFEFFMRFLAPPTPIPDTPSIVSGRALFSKVGCALCHTPTLHTGKSSSMALSEQPVHLFSDLLLHHMGPGLADNIIQGSAGPDEFRTAPLWGLGQRIFFLHDGRTNDLLVAIQAHASQADERYPASEANQVIAQFNRLPVSDKQNILNFLRGL